MIHIAICDDNETSVKLLFERVTSYFREHRETIQVNTYTQSKMLLYDIQENRHFDLILTDIEMPHMDGMALAASIKECLPEVLILFITSHLKYAVDAFELSIFRYIPKNQLDVKLPLALEAAVQAIHLQEKEEYLIQTTTRLEKIPHRKILYIQREGKNSILVLTDGTAAKVRKSLTQVFGELKSDDFIYVDRGDIVNLAHIVSVKDGIVELKNGVHLPASQAKLEQIKERLNDFWEKNL